MNASELLTLLGLVWSRLLLFPGGLALLVALIVVGKQSRRDLRCAPLFRAGGALGVSAVASPWLALALLPLAGARTLSRPLDLVVTLTLLEWPLLVALVDAAPQSRLRRAAAALNSYPPLLVALLLATAHRTSFDLSALAQLPDATGALLDPQTRAAVSLPALSAVVLHWLGALALLLAVPPWLGIGPFAAPAPAAPLARLGLALRQISVVVLAALPLLALLPLWLQPLPPLVAALAAWLLHRCTTGQKPRRWARGYAFCTLALVALLLLPPLLSLRS